MTSSRARAILASVSLLLCFGGAAQAAAPTTQAAPVLDPTATRVWAPCANVPGTMSMTIQPPAPDGTSQVTLVGRHMVEESKWRIQLGFVRHPFHRTASGNTWTLSKRIDLKGDDVTVAYAVPAGQRLADLSGCELIVSSQPPAVGGALCHRGFQLLLANRKQDGTVVLRYLEASRAKDQLWHVVLSATESGVSQTVAFDGRTSPRGILRTKVVLDSTFVHPHFKVVATNKSGRSCRMRLNPSEINGTLARPLHVIPARQR